MYGNFFPYGHQWLKTNLNGTFVVKNRTNATITALNRCGFTKTHNNEEFYSLQDTPFGCSRRINQSKWI